MPLRKEVLASDASTTRGPLSGFATGSGSRTRTYDPRINSPLLYQLSYAGVLAARRAADDSKASSTPSTWGQTEGGCGVFRESSRQAREQIGDRGVLDQLDFAVARHHGRAARRMRRAVETDDWDSVAVTSGGDLISDTGRRHRHLGEENVRGGNPGQVAVKDRAG